MIYWDYNWVTLIRVTLIQILTTKGRSPTLPNFTINSCKNLSALGPRCFTLLHSVNCSNNFCTGISKYTRPRKVLRICLHHIFGFRKKWKHQHSSVKQQILKSVQSVEKTSQTQQSIRNPSITPHDMNPGLHFSFFVIFSKIAKNIKDFLLFLMWCFLVLEKPRPPRTPPTELGPQSFEFTSTRSVRGVMGDFFSVTPNGFCEKWPSVFWKIMIFIDVFSRFHKSIPDSCREQCLQFCQN